MQKGGKINTSQGIIKRHIGEIKMNLKGRNFLTLKDFTKEEILYLIDLSTDLKDKKKNRVPVNYHQGKNIALIFEKCCTGCWHYLYISDMSTRPRECFC